MITPTFANASIQNAVYNSRGLGATGAEATMGPGDMFVQPLWLGWTRNHWDFSAAYGFYAPVGQVGLTHVPWNLILNFRAMYEYYAENRVQGSSFSINLLKKF